MISAPRELILRFGGDNQLWEFQLLLGRVEEVEEVAAAERRFVTEELRDYSWIGQSTGGLGLLCLSREFVWDGLIY